MFAINSKTIATSIDAAKKLKADAALLYAGPHGVLFGTRSDAGTYLRQLSDEPQAENSVMVSLEDLTSALYRQTDVAMNIQQDAIQIKSRKMRSVIRLSAERAKPGDVLELWDRRHNGNQVPALARMLSENRDLFIIKDHAGNKPIPVHIRWNKRGVAAGMSDQYHGVSIRAGDKDLDAQKSRQVFVYSSWLPLLIEYLVPPDPKDGDKQDKPKALLAISESNISVSTNDSLLVLQAIVPGADTITLDEVAQIASANLKSKVKINMGDCNAAVRRSLSVLPAQASLRFSMKKHQERLRVEGISDSGSKITEEVSVSPAPTNVQFSSTVYNLLDITNAAVPECVMALADRALLFSYDYEATKSGTLYTVHLFSATTGS